VTEQAVERYSDLPLVSVLLHPRRAIIEVTLGNICALNGIYDIRYGARGPLLHFMRADRDLVNSINTVTYL
jgi:hypothetical protein